MSDFVYYFKKFQEEGIMNSLTKTSYFLRGLFYRMYFEECGSIQITGRIFIKKKNAKIKLGKCLIWKQVKFDMQGKSIDSPATLEIGDLTTIGDRTEIHVAGKVTIGKRCRIAWDCVIMDRNYHGTNNEREIVKPVIIKDDVWIGCRAIVLPGIIIGSHAVVAAGSVVTRSVPPYTLVAGNPAQVIRKLYEKDSHITSNR